MNGVINELSPLQYMMLQGGMRSRLADYYMKQACQERGRLYGLVWEDRVVSVAIVVPEAQGWDIAWISTAPAHRRRGHAAQLLRGVLERLENYARVHLLSGFTDDEAVRGLVLRCGFSCLEHSTVYSAAVDEAYWARFDALPQARMRSMLLGKSGVCLPFAQLTEDQLSQLRHSGSSDFENPLDPVPFLDDPQRGMDRTLSHASFHEGELTAYVLITRPNPSSFVIEQIAVSRSRRGGLAVLPLMDALRQVRLQPGITRMVETIADHNEASRGLLLSSLQGVQVTAQRNEYYYAPAGRCAAGLR